MTEIRNAGVMPAVAKAWGAIRAAFPEVPEVYLSLGTIRSTSHQLAHFGVHEPTPELMISYVVQSDPQYTDADLMGVLVHESVHSVAHARGVRDTSNRGRFHNSDFAELAAEMGLYLVAPRIASTGAATLTQFAAKHYRTQIAGLEKALTALRTGDQRGAGSS